MLNEAALREIFEERLALAKRKNNDYSGTVDNIPLMGLQGIAIRLFDKVCRLHTLTVAGKTQQVKDESIRDTLLDISNYSDYGCLLLDGKWECAPTKKWVVRKDAEGNFIDPAGNIVEVPATPSPALAHLA